MVTKKLLPLACVEKCERVCLSAPPGSEDQGFSSALRDAAIFRRPRTCYSIRVAGGWSVTQGGCMWSEKVCDSTCLTPLSLFVPRSPREEEQQHLLISPQPELCCCRASGHAARGILPGTEVPGMLLCLSGPLHALPGFLALPVGNFQSDLNSACI